MLLYLVMQFLVKGMIYVHLRRGVFSFILFRPYDRALALQTLQSVGVHVRTTESVLFQLLQTSENPHFKSVLKILKETNLRPNEFANDKF